MGRVVTSMELWNATRGAKVEVPGVAPTSYDFWPFVTGCIVRERLGEFGRAPSVSGISFAKGSPAGVGGAITRRRVLRLLYDDGSFEEQRVVKFRRGHSGDQDPQADTEPIWRDLATTRARIALTGGAVDYGFPLIKRTAQDALNKIMAAGAPSHFVAGTLTTYASTLVSLQALGSSHLELLEELCAEVARREGAVCEWDFVWNGSAYAITLTDGIGGTLNHPVEMGKGSQNNRRAIEQILDAQAYFSRVVPLGGADEELVTIGQAVWDASAAVYDGASSTTLTLSAAPIYVDGSPGTGLEFGSDAGGWFAVSSTTIPDQVVVAGDASGLTSGRFRLSDGTELTYIADPTAEEAAAVVERLERRTDIPPYANLAAEAGITVDASDNTGWTAIGAATVASTTDERYVRTGDASQLWTAAADEGVETAAIALAPSDLFAYHSFVLGIRVITGSIRVSLVDSSGTAYPEGEELDFAEDTIRGVGAGGLELAAGDYTVRVVALEDGTQFVVDHLVVTNSAAIQEYAERMGPTALWHEAAALLAIEGGIQPDQFSGDWFDLSYLAGAVGEESIIGGKAQIRDDEQGGVFGVDTEVRLVELERKYHEATHERRGRFGSRALDVTGFMKGRRHRRLPNAPTKPKSNPDTTARVQSLDGSFDASGRAVAAAGANESAVGIILSMGSGAAADIAYTHTVQTTAAEAIGSTTIEVDDLLPWAPGDWGVITDGTNADLFFAWDVGAALVVNSRWLTHAYEAGATVHRIGSRDDGIAGIQGTAGQVTADNNGTDGTGGGTPDLVIAPSGTLHLKARAVNAAGELGPQYPDTDSITETRDAAGGEGTIWVRVSASWVQISASELGMKLDLEVGPDVVDVGIQHTDDDGDMVPIPPPGQIEAIAGSGIRSAQVTVKVATGGAAEKWTIASATEITLIVTPRNNSGASGTAKTLHFESVGQTPLAYARQKNQAGTTVLRSEVAAKPSGGLDIDSSTKQWLVKWADQIIVSNQSPAEAGNPPPGNPNAPAIWLEIP